MSAISDSLSEKSLVVKRQFAVRMSETSPGLRNRKDYGLSPKSDPRTMDTVHVLAANINRLIDWAKDQRREDLTSNLKIAKRIGGGFSDNTVSRARRGDGSLSIANVAKIARAFGFQAFQLLTPGFDPSDPPEVVSEPQEKDVLRLFRRRPSQPGQPPVRPS